MLIREHAAKGATTVRVVTPVSATRDMNSLGMEKHVIVSMKSINNSNITKEKYFMGTECIVLDNKQ